MWQTNGRPSMMAMRLLRNSPSRAAVVHKWREVEFRVRPFAQISVDGRCALQLHQAHAGLRPEWPRDDREAAAIQNGFDRDIAGGDVRECLAIDARIHRNDDARRGFQQLPGSGPRQARDAVGRIDDRTRPGFDEFVRFRAAPARSRPIHRSPPRRRHAPAAPATACRARHTSCRARCWSLPA